MKHILFLLFVAAASTAAPMNITPTSCWVLSMPGETTVYTGGQADPYCRNFAPGVGVNDITIGEYPLLNIGDHPMIGGGSLFAVHFQDFFTIRTDNTYDGNARLFCVLHPARDFL
ncbi:MAG TPA: hypothetical protein VER03_08755 [Bryobacteraceae bacterium]|nr:hypothetical protein [Bryobacteraceae bacterium]